VAKNLWPSVRFNQTMAGFWLDPVLVDAFLGDAQDPRGEAVLADQVAHLLPFHSELPNPLTSALSRITAHLGGDAGLLEWLDRHPGRPRLTSRLYVLIALLDRFSAEPAVVTALRELREDTPYPPGWSASWYLIRPTKRSPASVTTSTSSLATIARRSPSG
jgi:hypothetical protein